MALLPDEDTPIFYQLQKEYAAKQALLDHAATLTGPQGDKGTE